MKDTKNVEDFLSTLDFIQSTFRNSIVGQQRMDRAEEAQGQAAIRESSAALTRHIDSQRGTF
jgi:hypothetical protein